MENSAKAMLILTVTDAMILVTAIGVASVTQAVHADKGGIPDAYAGTHPIKSCISHPTQNKCTKSQVAE
jgi:hypothetical protein